MRPHRFLSVPRLGLLLPIVATATMLVAATPPNVPPPAYNPYAPYGMPSTAQVRPEAQVPAGTPEPGMTAYPNAPLQLAPPTMPESTDHARRIRQRHARQQGGPPYPPGQYTYPTPYYAPQPQPAPADGGTPPGIVTPLAPSVAPVPVTMVPPPAYPVYPELQPVGATPPAPPVAPAPMPPVTPPTMTSPAPAPSSVTPYGVSALPAPSFPTYAPAQRAAPQAALNAPPPTPAPMAPAVMPQPAQAVPPSMLPPPMFPGDPAQPQAAAPATRHQRRRTPEKPAEPDIQTGPVTEQWQAEEIRNIIQGVLALRVLPEKGANPTALYKVMDLGRRSSHVLNFPGWPGIPRFMPRADENTVRDRSFGAWEYRHYGSFQTRLNGWIKPTGQFLNFDLEFKARDNPTIRVLGAVSLKGALRGRIEVLGIRRDGYYLRAVLDLDGVFIRNDGYPAGGRMVISGTNLGGAAAQFPLQFPIDIRRMPKVLSEYRVSDGPPMSDANK